jgi:hypothetical protein
MAMHATRLWESYGNRRRRNEGGIREERLNVITLRNPANSAGGLGARVRRGRMRSAMGRFQDRFFY